MKFFPKIYLFFILPKRLSKTYSGFLFPENPTFILEEPISKTKEELLNKLKSLLIYIINY